MLTIASIMICVHTLHTSYVLLYEGWTGASFKFLGPW